MFVRPFPNSHGLSYIELRVCLFGGEIGWIENFEKKIGRKTFLKCVWLGGKKEKKWWSSVVFSPSPSKSCLPKMERQLKEENRST